MAEAERSGKPAIFSLRGCVDRARLGSYVSFQQTQGSARREASAAPGRAAL